MRWWREGEEGEQEGCVGGDRIRGKEEGVSERMRWRKYGEDGVEEIGRGRRRRRDGINEL